MKLKTIYKFSWGGGQAAPSESSPDFVRPTAVAPVGVTLLLGGVFVESSSIFPASEQAHQVKG
jgi:hypothetical protein